MQTITTIGPERHFTAPQRYVSLRSGLIDAHDLAGGATKRPLLPDIFLH